MDTLNLRQRILLNQPHIESVSGDIANFTTDMKAPLKECKVYFNPVQEGEGDPSPDNIRNITGWDGMTINACGGKNLLNIDSLINAPSGIMYSGDRAYTFIHVLELQVKPNTNYTLSTSFVYAGNRVLYFNTAEKNNSVTSNNPVTITTDENGYVKIGLYNRTGIDDFLNKTVTVQLEEGNVTTEYEPYKGTTIPINWHTEAGTVYGGYVDLISGELVAEYESVSVLWSEWTFGEDLGNNTRKVYSTTHKSIGGNAQDTSLCNLTNNYLWSNSIDTPHFYVANNGNSLYTILPNTLSENQEVQITYKLAEPIHYSLTPQQLLTFKGENNIWSNTNGQTEVKFWTH